MKQTILALAALVVVGALALAGCGGGSNSSASYGSAEGKAASSAGAASVTLASASGVGRVLVDSNGMTLYYFEKDKQGGSTSACNGPCAEAWPPLITKGSPQAGEGAQASKLGTIRRSDGTTQVTYAGWPLYTYVKDTKPGEVSGSDVKAFGASWYPLHGNGEKAGS